MDVAIPHTLLVLAISVLSNCFFHEMYVAVCYNQTTQRESAPRNDNNLGIRSEN